MTAPLYTARHGLIWAAASKNVRTLAEATEAAPHLLDMALTELDADLAQAWSDRLTDLISAIREAKAQIANQPQEIAA